MNHQQPAAITAQVPLDIPFHDIDVTGVAWHGRYLKYFELARDALMDKIGYNYAEMRQAGVLFPVVDVQIRYLRPLHLHQPLQVVAVLKEWEMRVVIEYRIQDDNDLVHCKGKTVQVAVKAGGWELQLGCPQELQDKVTGLLALSANQP